MTDKEKLEIVNSISPVLETIGISWEFAGVISDANYITVWHSDFEREDGEEWVFIEDIKSGKQTPRTILQDIIIALRYSAKESVLSW
jgi:hypothetical protein